MPDKIHLTVATVVCRDDKFLVVRERDNGNIVINQPAGHVEPGESLQAAALRETLEETGWQVELTGFLGISHYKSPNNGKTYYRVSFTAEPLAREDDCSLDPDIISAEWLDVDALRTCDILRSPMVLSDIEKFITGTTYPLSLVEGFQSIPLK